MNIAAFIARRIAFNQQRSFSRFVIRLSIGATVISVAIMILTLAFASGFQKTISQKVFSFWGHIRIQSFDAPPVAIAEEYPVEKNDSVLQLRQYDPRIKSVQAFATKNAILKTTQTIEAVLLKGVEQGYDFSNLQNFLVEGRWVQFTDSGYSNEINLSSYTAGQLNLKVNDQVLIYFIPKGGTPRPRKLTVAGIFKTGIEDYDRHIAIGDLKLIQRMNDWDSTLVGGYEIFLHDYELMDPVSDNIVSQLPLGMKSTTIKNIYPNIFDWLALQNKTIAIVLIIMVVIATLNLITCLLILVLERTRMIGVLKALGARNNMVQKIFLYHGAVITFIGLLLGNVIGLGVCWLQQRYGFIPLPEDAYWMSKAVADVVWWQILVVDIATFLICFLVLLIPTVIVRKVRPVKAIRFS
ncbi:FtsX-like permease family protein [Paraflavitalea sp. CAU 1676]|uniref:ABC transporter permease n=1 Tax=Paraflavitalea sp. CAU 1676 TaxID=3032598 RepID=UPI0023D9EC82|nr:FtsX-like permease family protein [Paraflavitalea sp. CAU 1676]MDF2190176.1 ABC transporter permease [Paraflavitalea sp. CAU 1676]